MLNFELECFIEFYSGPDVEGALQDYLAALELAANTYDQG